MWGLTIVIIYDNFCGMSWTISFYKVVILITVVKKASKIPKRQMDTVRKRMKEVLADE